MSRRENEFEIILPSKGTGYKELKTLKKRRPKQTSKAIERLKVNPTQLQDKNIEKLKISELGSYSIRVSGGDRIFYDVDLKNKKVFLLRAGKHDLYKRIS